MFHIGFKSFRFKGVRRQLLSTTRKPSPARPPAAPGVNISTVVPFMAAQWPDNPYDNFQGLNFHEITGNHCVIKQTIPSRDMRPGNFISGPAQFAAADVGMWACVFGAHGFDAMAMTSEMSIRFLRPAVGATLWSHIELNSAGSRSFVMTCTNWVHNFDNPCSVAQGTYVLPK